MRATSLVRIVVAGVVFTLFTAASAIGQTKATTHEKDSVFGTWRLNLDRSRYYPGPPPRSETRTYEPEAGGIKATITRVRADGRKEVLSYTANFDNPATVAGSEDIDRILMRRVDDFTAESVLSHGGTVYALARRVIARDGKTMTITLRREGQRVMNNLQFYDRITP